MKFRRNLDNNLDKIQTIFRPFLDIFRQNLDNAQKFRACPKLTSLEKIRQNLDMSEKVQTKFRQIQNTP